MKTRKWEVLKDLNIWLSNPVLKTLKQLEFFEMTPVQVIYK